MCGLYACAFAHKPESIADEVVQSWMVTRSRGQDSAGFELISRVPTTSEKKKYITFMNAINSGVDLRNSLLKASGGTIIGNWRGEPTTEWVKEKTFEDVQPFLSPSGRWHFVHNGTIANDRDIRNGEEWPTEIDSYAIGVALDRYGFEETVKNVLKGSFAIIAVDESKGHTLHVATNYKPLYYRGSFTNLVQVASTPEALEHSYDKLHEPGIRRIEPYHYGTISYTKLDLKPLITPKKEDEKRTLVVCSGGLDSSVVAWHHHKTLGQETTLLHFRHEARAQDKEVESVLKLSQHLGTDPIFLDTDFFKVHASSVLTDETKVISTEDGTGNGGAEFAHEWVPARNTVFGALALAIAESRGFDVVAFGINLEESGAFPDNEPEWARMMQTITPYAMKPYSPVQISTPVGNMMKSQIVHTGIESGVPFEATWSCYDGGDVHCGKCGPCWNRKTAFEMNGKVDPVFQE